MTKPDSNNSVVCQNRKARHEYHVLDTLECGIVLVGSEIKSIRNHLVSLEGSFATITNNEVWMIGVNIDPYKFATTVQHEPKRKRKLLLKKKEIEKFADKAEQAGHTLVPLKLYLKNGICKVELAVCKGKQAHDKRESEKLKEAQRDIKEFG